MRLACSFALLLTLHIKEAVETVGFRSPFFFPFSSNILACDQTRTEYKDVTVSRVRKTCNESRQW